MWGQGGLPSRELENAKAPRQTPGTFQRLAGPKQGGSGEREVWRVSPRGTEAFAVPKPHKQRAGCWGGISASSTRAPGWESQSPRGAGLTLCKTAEGIKLQLVPLKHKLVESRRNSSPKFCSFSLSECSQALPGTGKRRVAARVPRGHEQPQWRHWGFSFCRGSRAYSQQRGPGAPMCSPSTQ